MIEPAFSLATVLADHGQVVEIETAASFRRNLGVDFKSPRLDRPAAVMAMMAAQIVLHKMPQVSQRVIEGLPSRLCPLPLSAIQLIRPLHEKSLMMLAQLHGSHILCSSFVCPISFLTI